MPHLLASALGLSAIMHMGAAYLLYLAWQMWKKTGALAAGCEPVETSLARVAWKGVALNILNPKLTVFFLAFLPHFILPGAGSATGQLVGLSAVFMLMTFVVFCLYGLLASGVRTAVSATPRATRWVQRSFALVFAGLAVDLAFGDR